MPQSCDEEFFTSNRWMCVDTVCALRLSCACPLPCSLHESDDVCMTKTRRIPLTTVDPPFHVLMLQMSGEPPNANNAATATALYSLTVTNLTVNTRYILYRTTGLFAGGIIPQSASALGEVCTAQGTGCTAYQFTATSTSKTLTQTQAGSFVARR